MKKTAQKFMRDNMDYQIQKYMKKVYPNFEFQHQFLKMPIYSKIVLYSNAPTVTNFISQIFPVFKYINPKPSSASDEDFTRSVATEIISPNEDSLASGIVVHGFPFNANQALILDRYLQGVNLALHVKSGQSSSEYEPMLKYYEEKGALLELDYQENFNAEELTRTQNLIRMSLKSNL